MKIEHVTAMGPLIDTALEKVDKQHAKLTQLSSDLVDAMNLYHLLMREPAISSYTLPKMPPQQMVYQYPHPQGAPHPQTGHPQQGHPQAGNPQVGHPQVGHPQGAPPHVSPFKQS
jgi:signal transducing adaptor molecule